MSTTAPSLEAQFRRSVREAFVQDAITDAAINQFAIELEHYQVTDAFLQKFHPDFVPQHDGSQTFMPSAIANDHLLMPLLQSFVSHMYTAEPSTGISVFPPSPNQDVSQFAALYAVPIYDAVEGLREQLVSPKPSKPADHSLRYLYTSVLEQMQLDGTNRIQQDPGLSTEFLKSLSKTLRDNEAHAFITCGGSVSMADLDVPLSLRFDGGQHGPKKVVFDTTESTDTSISTSVEALARHCQEATFGFQGQDVLDKTYRNALQMDPSEFSGNFHPFDLGILHTIAHLLLPQSSMGSLQARLYKLNIYGPGGKFKSHVDTPRSAKQFGSLVICLPANHGGGELVIRHKDQSTTYSWGNSPCLEWAAFYSDCEHEVLEVTTGFRVTLTYNLLYCETAHTKTPHLKTKALSLFPEIESILQDPHFLPSGGLIGFHCAHMYPRNQQGTSEGVPLCLKGVDRALWLVLQRLDLPKGVHLVFDKKVISDDIIDEQERGMSDDESSSDDDTEEQLEMYRQQLATTGRLPVLQYHESDHNLALDFMGTFDERLQHLLQFRRVLGVSKKARSDGSDHDRVLGDIRPAFIFDDQMVEGGKAKAKMFDQFSSRVDGIHWLNQQRNMEMQLAYMAYGNEAELNTYYASAAILARIPPYSTTRGKVE